MVAIALLALALARPPVAYVDTGAKHVPLTISSWCWASRCGAPIARAPHALRIARGSTVRVHLGFAPTEVALAVGGVHTAVVIHGTDVQWRATRGGGLSLTATGVGGFVTYVARVVLK